MIVLLLLCAIAVGTYLFQSGKLDDVVKTQNLFPVDPMKNIELEPVVKPIPTEELIVEEKKPVPKERPVAIEPPKKRPRKKPSKQYFLKVGDCLYNICVRNLAETLKRMKQPVFRKKAFETTQYFEITSTLGYNKERAQDKIRILKKYAKTVGMPYWIKRKSKYWVTYGQYPDKIIAARTLSYLHQFSADAMIYFRLIPRTSSYAVTRVYAGPYIKKRSAERVKKRLGGDTRYREMPITSKP